MGNGYRQNMDKSLKLALIVSFIMSLLLIYPCSVGIMGTETRQMTLWEAISMGLPVMDFVKRFVLPGVIPAILFGFIIGGIVPVWPILVGKQIAE